LRGEIVVKKYTRIKHEVLENIFTRGLLSKREMQIALLIIRESWGWDSGKSNWTKRLLSNNYLSEKTGLAKETISREIKRMIEQGKILISENGNYSFNEHLESWKLIKHQLLKSKKVDKTSTKSGQNINWKLIKHQLKVDKTSTFDGLEINITTIPMKDLRPLLKLPKESIKEIFKEIFKESTDTLRQFYEEKIGKKLKTFGEDRRTKVKARMENFSLNDLKRVIENISNSDWHMGRDPKTDGKDYNNFELLFRSDIKVEQYLNLMPDQKFAGIKAWLAEQEEKDEPR